MIILTVIFYSAFFWGALLSALHFGLHLF